MRRNLPILLAFFVGLTIATCNALGQGISDVLEAAEAATPGPSHLEGRPNTAPASGIDKLIADENAAFEAGYRTAEAAMRGQEIQPEPELADERSVLTSSGLTEFEAQDAAKLRLTAEQYKAWDARLDRLEKLVAQSGENIRRLSATMQRESDPDGDGRDWTVNGRDITQKLHDCDCGPDCTCEGECKCEWPGQCVGKPRPSIQQLRRPPTINWRSSLNENARTETRQTGKLGFIFFTIGKSCPGCVEDETRYFKDPRIIERLNEHYVCIKVDVSKIAPETLRRWGVRTVPHYIVTDANWNLPGTRLQRWTPEQFYERLEVIPTPRDRNASASTKYPTRFAVYRRTGYEVDENYVSNEPIEAATELNLEPTQPRVRTSTVASNGSAGGWGGRYASNGSQGGTYLGNSRVVRTYVSAPYAVSYGESYGSSGGVGGMASGGSSGGAYGWGSPQPAYYEPAYYSQPTMVCGPWGCSYQ